MLYRIICENERYFLYFWKKVFSVNLEQLHVSLNIQNDRIRQ